MASGPTRYGHWIGSETHRIHMVVTLPVNAENHRQTSGEQLLEPYSLEHWPGKVESMMPKFIERSLNVFGRMSTMR